MADTHTVMPKKLAQALMEAGMQHYDAGGLVSALGAPAMGIGGLMSANGGNPLGAVANYVSPLASGLGLFGGGGSGLGESNFNATAPNITTQDFNPQIQKFQGQQNDVYNQQQNLAQALLNQSQGVGPNPAQAALAQQTGANNQAQAALMASQRGAGANPALIARQAAMQGAAQQQAATGQSATLQAQQQLAAQQALAQQQAQMANQALQGESIQQGGLAAQNTAQTTGQLGAQNVNANVNAQNTSTRGGILGGLIGGGGAILGGLLNKGGEVKKMALGGQVNDNLGIAHFDAPTAISPVPSWAQQGGGGGGLGGGIGAGLAGLAGGLGGDSWGAGLGAAGTGIQSDASALEGYGLADSMLGSGAETLLPAAEIIGTAANKGGEIGKVPFSTALLRGGTVPGKAKVSGDSIKNDTEPTLLSPGEVVLPRSVTQSPNAAEKAAEFIKHLQSKKKGYGSVIESRNTKKLACGGKV